VKQQTKRTLEHLNGFGVAPSLPVQSRQVMPQTRILPFYPRHVSFAHDLVTFINEHWIDCPAISDIKETMSALDDQPQELERCGTGSTHHPSEDSGLLVIHRCPNPQFVALFTHPGL
jgi:hypothetical protein